MQGRLTTTVQTEQIFRINIGLPMTAGYTWTFILWHIIIMVYRKLRSGNEYRRKTIIRKGLTRTHGSPLLGLK